ncbi:MAG: adenosylcobinamide-phosphate synthase CbiB [Methylotenera sp.]
MSFDYYLINHYPISPFIVSGAFLLDCLLGEPRRWHPLAGFGYLANKIEGCFNRHPASPYARLSGLLGWLVLLAPLCAAAYFLSQSPYGWLADLILLYFAIGARSLCQHAQAVTNALADGDLAQARHAVAMIVSRDTGSLDETGIATATVESVLENGNDAVFGAIFWFMLLGGTGALMFRLANTLDAMWGYRTPRFLYFGWAAARLDDLLNLIPARLAALTYALCGQTAGALKCWFTQAKTWYSPNAGPVMAAGAGALHVKLGGAAIYHGQRKERPLLGMGDTANRTHIDAAIHLINRSILLWCAVILLGSACFA